MMKKYVWAQMWLTLWRTWTWAIGNRRELPDTWEGLELRGDNGATNVCAVATDNFRTKGTLFFVNRTLYSGNRPSASCPFPMRSLANRYYLFIVPDISFLHNRTTLDRCSLNGELTQCCSVTMPIIEMQKEVCLLKHLKRMKTEAQFICRGPG